MLGYMFSLLVLGCAALLYFFHFENPELGIGMSFIAAAIFLDAIYAYKKKTNPAPGQEGKPGFFRFRPLYGDSPVQWVRHALAGIGAIIFTIFLFQ